MRAPAITVVGEVAALHDELAWFGAGPLAGRSVAVTRARAQASALAARLRALGASVVEAPAIRIEPLDATLPDLAGFDLLCVTSPNGARRLLELCRDARDLRGPAIAAIGPGTADALRAGGIEADVVPPRAVAESLVEALADRPVRRALIARAEQARDVLPDALRARGAEVEILPLYRTVAEPLDDDARAAALGADYVTFTSASAVRFFVEAAGAPDGPQLVSIGPITSDALREHGARAARRGGRAHARRPRRGAARGRRRWLSRPGYLLAASGCPRAPCSRSVQGVKSARLDRREPGHRKRATRGTQMGLFRREKPSQRPVGERVSATRAPQQPIPGNPELPGIAGYAGIEPLPKGAMPVSRFNYRRPDGKE